MSDRRDTLTLHQRILNDIEGRIRSGEWPPGYHLPFEMDLAAQYGCSRMTVNKVMTQLSQAGLIERRKKSGTFVSYPRSQSAVLEIRDIREEVESLGLAYDYRLISRALRPRTAADLGLGFPSHTEKVLALSCVHYSGGMALCYEERLIDVSVVPSAVDMSFVSVPPGRWLLDEISWSAGEHRIGAVGASDLVSHNLDIGFGSACLFVERRTWHLGSLVTHVVLTYPSDRHSVIASFGH
ncbi:GntR family transcriptional regulator [Rhizobium sp. XQZ8]|uniref:UTRA domain-containing protein n=1 Tax=Rhizobium populisoli TaxID=2859785 RepID=UPI001CA4884A|nr:UTRA domain-containing protein [Rhizobium populisoli]MBW6426125.1 GntR family transcriptional regulator [Rhizobium populisoli]